MVGFSVFLFFVFFALVSGIYFFFLGGCIYVVYYGGLRGRERG